MAEPKFVTLLAVEQITPYKKGDVFGLTEEDAAKVLKTKKVVKYDPKNAEHVAALELQRGKPVDAE